MTKAQERDRLQVALWWKQLKQTSNDTFLPLYFDESRYLVLKGGGGSGKSVFAARKVLERTTSEPGHRWLVTRKVDKTIRESCFEQLKDMAYTYYPEHIAKIPQGKSSDMYIKLRNGSEILFSGLDNVEKLKSIFDITGIWCEEASELEEGDFNQLDIRLRTDFDYYLQLILSFNPIAVTHWLKKRFFDRKDPRARVHESTYKDNRFLTEEAIRTLESFREIDEYYYMVYCLGQWGVTGKTVFNAKAVAERLEYVKKHPPLQQGRFLYDLAADGKQLQNIRWEDDPDGPVKLYRLPEEGRPYVIGGDTAGDGSDWFTGQVLDNISGHQVAVLRHRYDEDTYAEQMYCLGKFYNDALEAPECNFSTYPVKRLNMMRYPRLYVRKVEDTFDGTIRHAYGFRTDRLTRPVIISELIRVMRDGLDKIHDEDTLMEMLTFVRSDSLRAEAQAGAHDDLIMALAIAYYIRPQQDMTVRRQEEKRTWSADMWEDYRRASPQQRKFLLEKWGHPKG